jgi:hypothetical protein
MNKLDNTKNPLDEIDIDITKESYDPNRDISKLVTKSKKRVSRTLDITEQNLYKIQIYQTIQGMNGRPIKKYEILEDALNEFFKDKDLTIGSVD